jgi:hypothetical protein
LASTSLPTGEQMMTPEAWLFLIAFIVQCAMATWLSITTKEILKKWQETVNEWRETIDLADGLSSELDAAIDVMRRRVSGEADVASMGEWLDLNYPRKEN